MQRLEWLSLPEDSSNEERWSVEIITLSKKASGEIEETKEKCENDRPTPPLFIKVCISSAYPQPLDIFTFNGIKQSNTLHCDRCKVWSVSTVIIPSDQRGRQRLTSSEQNINFFAT